MIAEHGSFTAEARNRNRAARVIGKLGYLLLASVWGLTASAQTAPPSNAAPPVIEEIVVTGSRIASPNAASASPIQVVTSKEILATGKRVVACFGPEGLYWHPDHITVHRLTTAAVEALAAEGIAPWLYYATWPEGWAENLVAAMAARQLAQDLWGLHPKAFGGTLLELVEVHEEPAR